MSKHWTPAQIEAQMMRGAWFRSLPPELREELVRVGKLKHFPKGAELVGPGKQVDLQVVLRGSVLCSRIFASGAEAIYHLGRPGFWFGMMPALTGEQVDLTITAHTDVIAMVVAASDVVRITGERPEHYASLSRLPLLRLRRTLEMVDDSRRRDPLTRVAARLCHMYQIDVEGDEMAARKPLQVSQALLARMTNLSRQSVHRVLHDLVEAGAISLEFCSVTVCSPTILARLGDMENVAA